MKTFEKGKTYLARSVFDNETAWEFTVIDRTAKTITITDGETVKRCRLDKKATETLNIEAARPLGNYSLSPLMRADREAG